MSLSDAKFILEELLEKEINDSIINVYVVRDSLNNNIVTLKDKKIEVLNEKFNNQNSIINNLNSIVKNKNSELDIMKQTIKEQEKEIKKQKTLKKIGFITSIALPIIIVLLLI